MSEDKEPQTRAEVLMCAAMDGFVKELSRDELAALRKLIDDRDLAWLQTRDALWRLSHRIDETKADESGLIRYLEPRQKEQDSD